MITKYLQVSAWREKYPEYPGLRRRDKVVDEKPRFVQREKRAGDRLGSGKSEKCPVEDRGARRLVSGVFVLMHAPFYPRFDCGD